MRFRILELRGISPQAAKALEKVGIYYAEELLTMDVQAMSQKTGIDGNKLQTWKDDVMLMKIKSVSPNNANLLHRENVGIFTVDELSNAHPEVLWQKLTPSNREKRLVKVLPTLPKVVRWIEIEKKTINFILQKLNY